MRYVCILNFTVEDKVRALRPNPVIGIYCNAIDLKAGKSVLKLATAVNPGRPVDAFAGSDLIKFPTFGKFYVGIFRPLIGQFGISLLFTRSKTSLASGLRFHLAQKSRIFRNTMNAAFSQIVEVSTSFLRRKIKLPRQQNSRINRLPEIVRDDIIVGEMISLALLSNVIRISCRADQVSVETSEGQTIISFQKSPGKLSLYFPEMKSSEIDTVCRHGSTETPCTDDKLYGKKKKQQQEVLKENARPKRDEKKLGARSNVLGTIGKTESGKSNLPFQKKTEKGGLEQESSSPLPEERSRKEVPSEKPEKEEEKEEEKGILEKNKYSILIEYLLAGFFRFTSAITETPVIVYLGFTSKFEEEFFYPEAVKFLNFEPYSNDYFAFLHMLKRMRREELLKKFGKSNIINLGKCIADYGKRMEKETFLYRRAENLKVLACLSFVLDVIGEEEGSRKAEEWKSKTGIDTREAFQDLLSARIPNFFYKKRAGEIFTSEELSSDVEFAISLDDLNKIVEKVIKEAAAGNKTAQYRNILSFYLASIKGECDDETGRFISFVEEKFSSTLADDLFPYHLVPGRN